MTNMKYRFSHSLRFFGICWHILSHEHPSAKTLLHYVWSPEAVDLWNYDQLFCPIRFSLEQMRQVDSASWAYPISYPLPVYLPPALKIFRAVIYAHIAVALFWAVQILCWYDFTGLHWIIAREIAIFWIFCFWRALDWISLALRFYLPTPEQTKHPPHMHPPHALWVFGEGRIEQLIISLIKLQNNNISFTLLHLSL